MARQKVKINFAAGFILCLIALELLVGGLCVYFSSSFQDVRIKSTLEGVGIGLFSAGIILLSAEISYLRLFFMKMEKIITDLLKHNTALGRHGLCAVYRTRQEVAPLYSKVFQEAKFITICGISAKDIIHNESNLDVLVTRAKQGCKLRIVLSHPDSVFLRKRSMEEYGNETTLPQEVRDSITFLEQRLKKGKRLRERMQVFLHNTYPQGSLILTDKRVLFGSYLFAARGSDTPWIEFEHGRESLADVYGLGNWSKASGRKGHVERIIDNSISLQEYLEATSDT